MSLNPFFTQAKIQIMDFFSFSITSQKVTGSEDRFIDYLEQIETISGYDIPENQRSVLINYYDSDEYDATPISPNLLDQSHNTFSNSRKALIKEWEEETGYNWSKYNHITKCVVNNSCKKKQEGWNYDAHHIIPQSHGGPNEWWNLYPLDERDHNLIHGMNVKYTRYYNFSIESTLSPAFCCQLFPNSCVGMR
jgi:hypothetical protein